MEKTHEARLRRMLKLESMPAGAESPGSGAPRGKPKIPEHYQRTLERAEKLQIQSMSRRGFDATQIALIAVMAEEIQRLRDLLEGKTPEAEEAAAKEQEEYEESKQRMTRGRGRPRKESVSA